MQVEQHFCPADPHACAVAAVAQNIAAKPGMVLYTMVDDGLGRLLEQHCRALNVPVQPILAPVLRLMAARFINPAGPSGATLINSTMPISRAWTRSTTPFLHVDGQRSACRAAAADVVLVGVSRTRKRRPAFILANRGIKAANVPLVPAVPFPQAVLDLAARADGPLFVALTAAPERLVDIRRNRLQQLGEVRETSYFDSDTVGEEVRAARQLIPPARLARDRRHTPLCPRKRRRRSSP